MVNVPLLEMKVLRASNNAMRKGTARSAEIRQIQAKFDSIVKRDNRLDNDMKQLNEMINSLDR